MEFMKKFRIGSGLQNFNIRTPLVARYTTVLFFYEFPDNF